MSGDTSIQWTDRVWNPTRGCSRISEGCRHCYAETMASRFSDEGQPFHSFATRSSHTTKGAATTIHGPRWTGRVELLPDKLGLPLRWRRWAEKFAAPCPHCTGWVGPIIGASQCATCGGAGVVMRRPRVFVNSMSDLFHEKLSNEDIAAVFGVMAACPGITFQVLTKRPERMREWFQWAGAHEIAFEAGTANWAFEHLPDDVYKACKFDERDGEFPPDWPLPNVWLGVSVENQATADERIPLLLQTPAAVRFVSYEPALAGVDFASIKMGCAWNALSCACTPGTPRCDLHSTLDWLICGGESGPGARPMNLGWALSARRQCAAAGVAFFFKQSGAVPLVDYYEEPGDEALHEWALEQACEAWRCDHGVYTLCDDRDGQPPPGTVMRVRLRDRKGGDPSEFPEDLRVREFPS